MQSNNTNRHAPFWPRESKRRKPYFQTWKFCLKSGIYFTNIGQKSLFWTLFFELFLMLTQSFLLGSTTHFLLLYLTLLYSSWKRLLKSIFWSFLACFTTCSLTLKNSIDFWIVHSSVNFSFIESTNLWQLLESLFSVTWDSGSDMVLDVPLPIHNIISDNIFKREHSNISLTVSLYICLSVCLESILYEGLIISWRINNLSAEDGTVSYLWISEQKIKQFLNIGGCRLLIDLLMNIMLLIIILSSNFRTLLFQNNKLKWLFLGWFFIILMVFFCKVTILNVELTFCPHMRFA